MMAKFLWDPDYDENQAMTEFLEGVYGAAAGPIRRYIDLLHDKVAQDNIHMHIWEGAGAAYLTQDVLQQADKVWDEAEAAVAGQPETLKHVREARLSPDWALIERTPRATTTPYRFEGDRYVSDVDPVFKRRVERFFSAAEGGGLVALNEGGFSLATYRERVAPKIGAFDVATLTGDDLELRVVPGLGGRILSLRTGAKGPNLCYLGDPTDPGYPAAGGYAEWWGGTYQGTGWGAPFTAKAMDVAGGRALELTARLADGVELTRTITVPQAGRALEVVSKVANGRGDAQPADLRGQLALDLGPTDGITAVLPAMGDKGVISLSLPETEARSDLSFTAAQLAQGVTLANHAAGRGVRIVPSEATIERGWLRVDARRGIVTYDLKTTGQAPPGGSAVLRHQVEALADLAGVPQAQHTGAKTHRALRVIGQDDRIGLGHYGEWCSIVEDATASDGFSVLLNNNHIEWCVQWQLSPAEFEADTKYDVYARIKVDKKGNEGRAFWAGVYDSVGRADLGTAMPNVADIPDSEWHLYKLGTITPAAGQYVWMGPYNNAAGEKGLYLDYFELRAVEPEGQG
jgi:hypothetical protein